MKESIRQQRTEKLRGVLRATQDHLKRGLAALEDANLYSNDEQEHDVDTLSTRLQDIIEELDRMIQES